MKCFAVGFVVSLLATDIGFADLVLDQSFDAASSDRLVIVFSGQRIAQTFTVGEAGVLDNIGIQFRQHSTPLPNGDALLRLHTVTAGLPDTELGSFFVPRDAVPVGLNPMNNDFVDIDVSSISLMVQPGEVYAIDLSYNGDGRYGWHSTRTDASQYDRGERLQFNMNNGQWFSSGNNSPDLGFRTFVDTAAVPEPSAALMLLFAALPVTATRRRFATTAA